MQENNQITYIFSLITHTQFCFGQILKEFSKEKKKNSILSVVNITQTKTTQYILSKHIFINSFKERKYKHDNYTVYQVRNMFY